MTISQTTINSRPVICKMSMAAYLLEYLDPPSGETASSAAMAIGNGWGELLRWFLYPYLEPAHRDGPYTVICSIDTPMDLTTVAEQSAEAASITRDNGGGLGPDESDESLLNRALGVLLSAT